MKRKIFAIASLTVLLAGCSKTDAPVKANGSKNYDATEASAISQTVAKTKAAPQSINFTAPFQFPEGMVYDPFNDQFLVSSISKLPIGSVTKEGVYAPFISDGDLASTAGMEIDKAHKRLLVTSSEGNGSVAQLASYDLNTKARLFLVDLKALANDAPAPHLANDVAIDQHGNAYVTDSYAGIIYKVDLNGNASIFYQNTTYNPPFGGFGFNGIEYGNSNGGYLLVAHTAQGKIIKIPVDNPASVTTVQLTPLISNPDGLLLSKNGKELIIVNNNVNAAPGKVMSFQTSDKWATATGTGDFTTPAIYPTTLTSDGKTEYVLYSKLHHLLFGIPPVAQKTFTIQPLPFNSNNPF